MTHPRSTPVVAALAAGAAVILMSGLAACESSRRVRQEPGVTLPPLATFPTNPRRTTTTVEVVVTYVVRRGETLDLIAARLGVDPSVLAEVNDLDDPDLIEAGQILVVPTTIDPDTTEG